ncbi:MAG: hypothetical protein JXA99_07510, partial [Candidatus Lokiarchaeota archaeon]|nr:hypothetical protein [Candidatus Lokiarchaeota archaeon]
MLYVIFIFTILFCNTSIQFISNLNISRKVNQYNISISSSSQSLSNSTVISDQIILQYLNHADSFDSDIIVDDDGVVHVVWADEYYDPIYVKASDIMYRNYTAEAGWSDYIRVSQEYYWDDSFNPDMTIDNNGKIHIVWEQETDDPNDNEIIYAYYTPEQGWSNGTVISDGYQDVFWNNGNSMNPEISIDSYDNLYVVWEDESDGPWKYDSFDSEIMYVSYTEGTGWSNVTVLSDNHQGGYSSNSECFDCDITVDSNDIVHVVWSHSPTDGINNENIYYTNYSSSFGWSNIIDVSNTADRSIIPKIEADNIGAIHLVWHDLTDGPWGVNQAHILYRNYTIANGWSPIKIASDGYQGVYWNEGAIHPDLAVDNNNDLHLTWTDLTDGPWGSNPEIMYAHFSTKQGWSNATLISDGFQGLYWNTGYNEESAIAVDNNGGIHIIWEDNPMDNNAVWSSNYERDILYINYTSVYEWSNISVISDGFYEYWNHDTSYHPDITIGPDGTIHMVWEDATNGAWGSDTEIMYVNYSINQGWSDIVVISDGFQGVYWNNQYDNDPKIAVDINGIIHVVWEGATDGPWGSDTEIMYVNYSINQGWSNVTVISDGYQGFNWNKGASWSPDITVEDNGNIHIVWQDYTPGPWGSYSEIMYVKYSINQGWSNITVISDGYQGVYWNNYYCYTPKIDVDISGIIHVVWEDHTNIYHGYDQGIMYVSYTEGTGWSNASIISKEYENEPSSFGYLSNPDLVVSHDGDIHVVWEDCSYGIWGTDKEIMYKYYDHIDGWSPIKLVSDGYKDVYWNNDDSFNPIIALDNNGDVHIAWQDSSDGIWRQNVADSEIMYTKILKDYGILNITVISDGYMGFYWNTESSGDPAIAVNNTGGIHIVWNDYTDGDWGTDTEIFYTSFSSNEIIIPFELSTTATSPEDDDGEFSLQWSNLPDFNNYTVYQSESFISEINGSQTNIANELSDTSIDLSIYDNGTYYFIIEAKNNYESRLSNCISVTVNIPPPEPPQEFTLSTDAGNPYDDDGDFTLQWEVSIGADNYTVYQSDSYITEIDGNQIILATEIQDRILDLSDYDTNTYYFIILAKNEIGETLSNCIEIDVDLNPQTIPEPFELSTTATYPWDNDGNFTLEWTESIGADNYTVYQSDSYITVIDGNQIILATEIQDRVLDLSNYANGTYYFIVSAQNEVGIQLSNCIVVIVFISDINP